MGSEYCSLGDGDLVDCDGLTLATRTEFVLYNLFVSPRRRRCKEARKEEKLAPNVGVSGFDFRHSPAPSRVLTPPL
jgi:hypothetical protein